MAIQSLNIDLATTYVCGDFHGDWSRVNTFINKKKPSTILQLGDFGYWPKFSGTTALGKTIVDRDGLPTKQRTLWFQDGIKTNGTKIHFVDGNHEDHWSLNDLNGPMVSKDVFYMKRGSVWTLPDGRNILCMGGARSIDQQYRTESVDWFREETISYNDIADIPDIPDVPIDIVLSHTCPTEFLPFILPNDYRKLNDPCYEALSHILNRFNPKLWYFAHFHHYKTGFTKGCKWIALNIIDETGWFTKIPNR